MPLRCKNTLLDPATRIGIRVSDLALHALAGVFGGPGCKCL